MFHPSKTKVIAIVSKNQGHAKKILDDIKTVLEYSENFKRIFGYWGKEVSERWSDEEIVLRDGSLITTKGADMQIVGLNWRSQRPTFVIYDDPQDHKNTLNQEQMEKTLKTLMKDVEPGVDPKHGKIWLIGTPQREGCLVLKVKDMPGWVTLHYDAIVNEEKKKVLWPEWISYQDLMDKLESFKAINRVSIFFSEYRCQIIGDEDQLFLPKDFRYWDGEFRLDNRKKAYIRLTETATNEKDGLDWVKVWHKVESPVWKPLNLFMGVDPASSVSNTADYSAIMIIGVDKDKNIYILDLFRKRVKPMELARTIIGKYKSFYPIKTNIETTGYQEMLRDYLKNESDVYIPGLEVKNQPRNSKSRRIETLQPFFYSKQVYFKKDLVNLEALEAELQLYPRVQNDDTLDAFFYAKKNMHTPYHTIEDMDKPSGGMKHVFNKIGGWMTA